MRATWARPGTLPAPRNDTELHDMTPTCLIHTGLSKTLLCLLANMRFKERVHELPRRRFLAETLMQDEEFA